MSVVRRLGVVALLAVLGLATAAAPASAAPGDILLSTDGTTFTGADTVDPLGDLGILVPGDSVQRSLWVKNGTARDAFLRLSVSDLVVPLTSFPEAITVMTTVGTSSRFDRLADLATCAALVRSTSIPAGGVVRIDFTIAMDASVPGLVAQNEAAQLGTRVFMRDVAAGPYPSADVCITDNGGSGSTGAGGGPKLPFTGTDAIPLICVAVVSLLGGVIAIIVARRRRRRDESEIS
jgi:hypothetical protein